MMTTLTRAQIRPGVQGIDTTVKSAQGIWRAYAPTWQMVMGLKAGTLAWDAYCQQYAEILVRVPDHVWETLAQAERQVMLCYCRDGWNCHTHELIAFAVRQFPERFVDGRPNRSRPSV
jgi:uncharacterized protein YeaO (DUF488 family)